MGCAISTEAAHGKRRRSNRERDTKQRGASAYALSTAPPVAAPAATVAGGRVPFPLSRPGAGAATRCPSPLGLSLPRPASSLSAIRPEAPIHARWSSQPLAEVKDHVRDWVAEDQEFSAEDRLKTFAAFPAGSEGATGLAASIEGDSAFLVDPGLDAAASASTTTTANVAATAAVVVSGAVASETDVRSTPSVEHPNAVSDRR